MRIRHLPETLINQIAAGEVIERPSAAIKELVENSIDADAQNIIIAIKDGGKSFMSVEDDGHGMNRQELIACLDRHATSKLPSDDLLDIQHLGFRGEALPSIASVSKMKLTTRSEETAESWQIEANAGQTSDPFPSSHPRGTKIEIHDLFYATPARLKFLKTVRSENISIKDIITRLAMTSPHIAFTLYLDDKKSLQLPIEKQEERLGRLLGREFPGNAMPILAVRENIKIEGMASLPTFNKSNSLSQYLFVNGRAVKDRLLLGALKGAYNDVLARDRYPVAALFFTVPSSDVDVNVHPAKSEVRFREASHVRGLLVSTIRHSLLEYSGRSASSTSYNIDRVIANDASPQTKTTQSPPVSYFSNRASSANSILAEKSQNFYEPLIKTSPSSRYESIEEQALQTTSEDTYILGAARAQIHENYIIAQTNNGMTIIDQHAAHERLVYEKLKEQFLENNVSSQGLLTPEIIDLEDDFKMQNLISHAKDFKKYGLDIEAFGNEAISVSSVPALLGKNIDIKGLIHDLCDEISEHGTSEKLQEKIFEVLSRRSCHGSIRSGRRMNADEMNYLLREMENTPLSGQCNHGRPTYIHLSLDEIEKLFKRR